MYCGCAHASGQLGYPRLEIDEDSPRNVARIVTLVVENILAVTAFCRKVLKVSVLTNPVLLAKLLPKLTANFPNELVISGPLISVATR